MPTASSASSSGFSYHSMLDSAFTRPPGMRLVLPDYDRRRVRAGILHFGVGVFHRSHLACYADQLLHCADTEPDCLNWGVCGVGIRPSARAAYEAFKAQDGLYSLIALGPDGGSTVRIVGSLVDFVFAPEQPTRLYRRLLHADTRCVSFTITEAAYRLSEADADTQRDIQRWPQYLSTVSHLQSSAADDGAEEGSSDVDSLPRSLFGWVVLGLEARRRAGLPPFTLLACDNVSGNGQVLKDCLLAFARAVQDQALLSFVQSSVSCPSSMVDRITALTGPDSIQRAKTEFGVIDRWPVFTEEWRQWCLQVSADASPPSFTAGSPPFHLLTADASNHVQLVPDVRPYEAMKLRLLNSSHSLCCYLGCLSGHRYVHDYYSKPDFVAFALRFMQTEVEPLMPPVPGVDLRQYEHSIIARFGNRSIRDLTLRICQDGASKLPQRLVPTLQASPSCHCATLAVAAWFAFLRGEDESGRAVPLQDPRAAELRLDAVAKAAPYDAKAMLEAVRPIFGQLSDDERFRQRLQYALTMLKEKGAEATLRHWLET